MTKEEAKRLIKWYYDEEKKEIDTLNEEIPEFEIAIECIERQIPKKVIPNEFGGYYCPGCKAFWGTKYGNFIDTNYCPNCGQAVDWDVEK